MAVEFRLLGAIEARVDDQVVDIGHARQRCVLAALLVQPGRPVPADVLIDHVWADQLPHHARNALSAYVSRLRGVLAATSDVRIVRGSGGYVLTADPMTVDLHRFRYLVRQARAAGDDEQATALYAQALELWQGEALATLDTPWINNTRHSLAAERLSAELDRNDVELRLGHHSGLLAELSIRAAAYPLHERLAGQLMLALYRSGRQAEALAHYERMRLRLADELGVVPTAPLQELYQQILTAAPQASQPAPAHEVRRDVQDLLERSALLTQLDAALTGGRVVLVAGEAGIGKSALVHRFIQRRERDVRFLVGLCDPLLTPRALGPLRDIAVQVRGKLAERLAAGAAREEVFAAFLDELAGYRGPQVVVVEDVQWADAATMDMLVLLGRRLERVHATLVVTYRDDELGAGHPLRALLSAVSTDRLVHVRPAPLSEEAVAELARRAGRASRGLHTITGGNPLLVTEVLAAGEPGVPATIRDLAMTRLAALTPTAQEVVRFVAVVPTRTELWLLKEALGPDLGAVEEAVDGGLLVMTGCVVAFRHELMRQAVEESLSTLRHSAENRRALGILSGVEGVDLARLVHHARQCGDIAALLRYAPPAAREAESVGAHREAVDHYRVALRDAGRLTSLQRAELLEGLSFNCYMVGFAEEALSMRQAALAVYESAGQVRKVGENLRWLSRLHWWAGRRAEAEEAAGQAIAVLEPAGNSRELAMAYSNQGQLHVLVHELPTAIEWSSRAIMVAEDDQETIAHALTNIGTARLADGDERGRADLQRAIDIATREGLVQHAARALVNLALMTVKSHNHQLADHDLDQALKFVHDHDLSTYAQYLVGYRACWRLQQGDWPGAERDARQVLDRPEQQGLSIVPALTALGWLQVRRGDAEATDTLREASKRAFGTGELRRLAPVAVAHAEHAWLTGQPVAGEVMHAFELAVRAGHSWLAGELGWWLSRLGVRVEVPDWVAEPYRLLSRGDWRAAAAVWERLGCPYEQADALGCGDLAARRRALEIFDRLGAAPAARHLRR